MNLPQQPPLSQSRAAPSLSIDPRSYDSAHVYRQELRDIFQKCWVCVGLTRELSQHNDWLLRDIGGVAVVVQNFHGDIRALHNVCAHRHSLLRTCESGNGPLQCGYHGWTYDCNGCPVGVPGNHEHFRFSDATRKERSLRQFEVASCGIFVFVRVVPGGPNLTDFLGNHWATLQHLSDHFGQLPPIDEACIPWATNWKIAMESVLEVYHVDTVHPDTFKRLVDSAWHFEETGIHSTAMSHLRQEMREWWDKAIARLGLRKSPSMDQYDHYVIFPNMAVGVTRGSLMSLQTYEPAARTACSLRYRMVLANTDQPAKVDGLIWKSVAQTIVDFNRKLLEEDRVASECTQLGLTQTDRPALLGINEGRIRLFHESLARYVDYPAACALP